MLPSIALGLAMLPLLGAAYTEDPPTTAAPDTIEDCTLWKVATDTDTCASISSASFITVAKFTTYNPSVANGCQLVVGNSYCIEQNWGIPAPTPTPTRSVTPPAPTSTAILAICEAEAGGYKRYCPRCYSSCAGSTNVAGCFDSVFTVLNYYDSQCWQHGGIDCANVAADRVCPQK